MAKIRTQVFICHASEDVEVAREIRMALIERPREVFFDKTCLPAGLGYHESIRIKAMNCDLFVFVISPDSLAKQRYTLNEIGYVMKRWPHPKGHVLPVVVRPVSASAIPKEASDAYAYLKSVTFLEPDGKIGPAVAAKVAELEMGLRVRRHAVSSDPAARARGIENHLEHLDREASSQRDLYFFSLILGTVSVALWSLFQPASPAHLRVGAGSAFAAGLLFYLQRSHLEWLRGQIGLVPLRTEAGSFTLRDWLTYADGWGTWVRYKAGWAGLLLAVLCYVGGFIEVSQWRPLWKSLWVPLSLCILPLLFVLSTALRWYVLTAFSDEDAPYEAWCKSLTGSFMRWREALTGRRN